MNIFNWFRNPKAAIAAPDNANPATLLTPVRLLRNFGTPGAGMSLDSAIRTDTTFYNRANKIGNRITISGAGPQF